MSILVQSYRGPGWRIDFRLTDGFVGSRTPGRALLYAGLTNKQREAPVSHFTYHRTRYWEQYRQADLIPALDFSQYQGQQGITPRQV